MACDGSYDVSPVVVLGAGLTGLSCAHHLGDGYVVVERESSVGGLARTIKRLGFSCDCTGHWLHLSDPEIRGWVDSLLPEELLTIERHAEVFSHGVRTPYPFQANTAGLPADVVADCVLGYFRAREAAIAGSAGPPKTFEQFIRQRLGDGIAEHFMLPYNAKLWTVPPAALSSVWCERFVPTPTPREVVYGALLPGYASHRLGYNATFHYPRQGGIGALAERLAATLTGPLITETEAREVHWQQRWVRLGLGSKQPYGALVSTVPLPDLVERLLDPPDAIRDAASRLRATSVTYWDVGVARPCAANEAHWTYFPEPEPPFYRVGCASAAVPYLAPPGHRSYYVEVSHRRGTPCSVSTEQILTGLRAAGVLGANEQPQMLEQTTLDCAYVIMDEHYGEARQTLLDWLDSQRILSTGRYGSWTYDSMEGALKQGQKAAAWVRER